MKTIETKATVTEERLLTIKMPSNIDPGEHQVVLVIDDRPLKKQPINNQYRPSLNFPVDSYGSWPDSLSLRHEEIYSISL